ncbi:hypothetical protein B0H12DRAFT_1145034, partial [Mycena haematopus]
MLTPRPRRRRTATSRQRTATTTTNAARYHSAHRRGHDQLRGLDVEEMGRDNRGCTTHNTHNAHDDDAARVPAPAQRPRGRRMRSRRPRGLSPTPTPTKHRHSCNDLGVALAPLRHRHNADADDHAPRRSTGAHHPQDPRPPPKEEDGWADHAKSKGMPTPTTLDAAPTPHAKTLDRRDADDIPRSPGHAARHDHRHRQRTLVPPSKPSDDTPSPTARHGTPHD